MAPHPHLKLVHDTARAKPEAKHWTDKALKALKPTAQRQELKDALMRNLIIMVQPRSGSISFVFRGRVSGVPRKLTVGTFPAMSLSQARDAVREIQLDRAKGMVPQAFSAPVLQARASPTVREAFETYMDRDGNAQKTASEKRRIFAKDIAPMIGDLPINAVTRHQLAGVVSAKFAKARTQSNRVHSELSRLFRWSIETGWEATGMDPDQPNPMRTVKKQHAALTVRKRSLNEQELGWLFRSLPYAAAQRPNRNSVGDARPRVMELLLRTVSRCDDMHSLRLEEIQWRGADRVIVVPDTKNGEDHLIWLHSSAAALINGQSRRDGYVFGITPDDDALDRVRAAMERFAEQDGEEPNAETGLRIPHWSLHDFRRTATTWLSDVMDEDDRSLVSDKTIDRLLGHKEQGVIKHYNLYKFYAEKKGALRLWGDYLDCLRDRALIN